MVPAYLLSLLSRQLLMLQADGFLKRHPHAWLVWEPGNWDSPRSPGESDAGATRVPDPLRPSAPEAGDALCFELLIKGQQEGALKVGRSSECQIVLNDMTISREQFQLRLAQGSWSLVGTSGAKTLVSGAPAGEQPVKLDKEARLKAGGLRLTFYQPPAFLDRLKELTPAQGSKR